MRKVIVTEWMSLDGVVQAPASPDEDDSGGFPHGGWHPPYFDEMSMRWVERNVTEAGAYLLGRRTYETFAAYWPTAPDEVRVLSEPLNTRPKYVATSTLAEPLSWQHSTVLRDDLARSVVDLKAQDGDYILVTGSTEVAQTLIEHDLVDEYRFMIDPLVLGGGKRLFRDDGCLRALQLIESHVATTGAILATYAPARG